MLRIIGYHIHYINGESIGILTNTITNDYIVSIIIKKYLLVDLIYNYIILL